VQAQPAAHNPTVAMRASAYRVILAKATAARPCGRSVPDV
jgi:hypothetical protein